MRSQIGQSANLYWIERTKEALQAAARNTELMSNSDLEQFDRLCGITVFECENRPRSQLLLQIIRERQRPRVVSGKG